MREGWRNKGSHSAVLSADEGGGAEVHYIHGEKSEQESYFSPLSVLHAKYPDTKQAGPL